MCVSPWSPRKTRAMKPPPKHQRSPSYSSGWLSPSRPEWLQVAFLKSLSGRHRCPGDSIWPTELCFKTPQSQHFWGTDELMLGPSVQLQAQGQASPEEDLALQSGSKRWPNFLYCPGTRASVPYEKFYRHWLSLHHMAFVPMEEENGRVSSDMSNISRIRTNSSCINSSSNTIPSIIHMARHFLPSWVILIFSWGNWSLEWMLRVTQGIPNIVRIRAQFWPDSSTCSSQQHHTAGKGYGWAPLHSRPTEQPPTFPPSSSERKCV